MDKSTQLGLMLMGNLELIKIVFQLHNLHWLKVY